MSTPRHAVRGGRQRLLPHEYSIKWWPPHTCSPRHLRHSVRSSLVRSSSSTRHSSPHTHSSATLHCSLDWLRTSPPPTHTTTPPHRHPPTTQQSQTGGPPPVRMSEAKGQDASEAAASKGTICVTGGSGFLGSWCVKMLLDKGYTVHATTRSAAKAAYLSDLDGAEVQRRDERREEKGREGVQDLAQGGVCHCSLTLSSSTHALLYPLRSPPAPDDLRWM